MALRADGDIDEDHVFASVRRSALALVHARPRHQARSRDYELQAVLESGDDTIKMVLTRMDGWYKGDEENAIIDTDVFVENAKQFGSYCGKIPTSALSPRLTKCSASNFCRVSARRAITTALPVST